MSASWYEIGIGISELLAIVLLWKLWASDDSIFFKIILSAISLVPFIGPFFVLWIANFPTRQPIAFQDRHRYSTDVFDRWRHVFSEKNPHTKFRMWQSMVEKNENDDNP